MGSFFSQHKGLIIGVFLSVLVFIGYAMIKPNDAAKTEGLQKTVVNAGGSNGNGVADDPAAAFVQQLLAIQNIKFDINFFNDPVYKELVDQSRPLGVREVGRPNPFLEIGIDSVGTVEAPARSFVQTSATSSATSSPAAPARPSTGSTTKTPSR